MAEPQLKADTEADGSGLLDADRGALYDAYDKYQEEQTPTEEDLSDISDADAEPAPGEEEAAEEDAGEPEADTEPSPGEDEGGEAATEPDAEQSEAEGQPEDDSGDRTVSLAALHEEREKRKALRQQLNEANQRLNQVLTDNEPLVKRIQQLESMVEQLKGGGDFSQFPDDDQTQAAKLPPEIERQIAELRQFQQQQMIAQQRAVAQQARQQLQTNLKTTGDALEGEGYPGFDLLYPHVQKELASIYEADPEEALGMDNPDGWKKLYKEIVYPNHFRRLKQMLTSRDKDEALEQKRALKAKAKLAAGPGSGAKPQPSKPESEKTPEERYREYMRTRRAAGIT